jgi:hypothetical protein
MLSAMLRRSKQAKRSYDYSAQNFTYLKTECTLCPAVQLSMSMHYGYAYNLLHFCCYSTGRQQLYK